MYDLTEFVTRHPGGKNKILDICGRDGTSAFQGQHEGERKPATILANYRIGDYISRRGYLDVTDLA